MSIKVRYFASLKELVGHSEDELAFVNISCVNDVWKQANTDQTIPDNMLAAVNMEYVAFDSLVNDGDEVAFFPPVTGG
jgi:molybdopterin synthase sulfur carrier subunit